MPPDPGYCPPSASRSTPPGTQPQRSTALAMLTSIQGRAGEARARARASHREARLPGRFAFSFPSPLHDSSDSLQPDSLQPLLHGRTPAAPRSSEPLPSSVLTPAEKGSSSSPAQLCFSTLHLVSYRPQSSRSSGTSLPTTTGSPTPPRSLPLHQHPCPARPGFVQVHVPCKQAAQQHTPSRGSKDRGR